MRYRLGRSVLSLVTVGLLAALTACSPSGSQSEAIDPAVPEVAPALATYPDIEVVEDVDFGAPGGVRLDVCLPDAEATPAVTGTDEPASSQPRPAMLSVHGGSWQRGDKGNFAWRSVCQWLASEGYVTFSVNYRLAPANPYPAAISDLRTAVKWIREDTQIEGFDIDPTRLGAFGGSAGGNLVALLGLEGEGPLDEGSRVAAVAELSAPVDLTTEGFLLGGVSPEFRTVQLDYLGCTDYRDCPQSRTASPLYDVDETDPPFFVGHSVDERIPIEQSDALVERLREDGIDVTYVTVEGTRHSIAMLDDELKARIAQWLAVELAG